MIERHEGLRRRLQLERDPILAELRVDSRFCDIIDRMRKDVDAPRARSLERGLLELDGLLAPANKWRNSHSRWQA